ncbi:MAG: ankyrin repeat domain-containing protein [Elusimicrobiota bacterium]
MRARGLILFICVCGFSSAFGQGPNDPKQMSPDRALFEAIKHFDEKGVLKALNGGADINAQDPNDGRGFTPLMKACHDVSEGDQESSSKMVDLLLSKGADVNRPAPDGMTALLRAACDRDRATVKKLLPRGADPNLGNYPIVMCAAQSSDREMLNLLIKHKANVNAADGTGNTALLAAAQRGDKAMVSYLLSKKADFRLRNQRGETALVLSKKFPEIQRILRKAGESD